MRVLFADTQNYATSFILIALFAMVIGGAAVSIGCDDPPRVVGSITLQVANQLSDSIPDTLWAAGLAWVNQQLAAEGIHVVLVPAGQGRGDAVDVVVTDAQANPQAKTSRDASDDPLTLVVQPGEDWKEQLLQQTKAAFGR